MSSLVLLLGFAAPASAAYLGDDIDEAIAVQLTPGGLATLGEVVERLVPDHLDVAGFDDTFECDADDEQPLDFAMGDLSLLINVDEVALDTADGQLVLSLYGGLSSTQSTLTAVGDCSVLTDLDEVCGLELPLTSFQARLVITIVETDGAFDAVVDDVSFTLSPINNPLSDCLLADGFGTILGLNESALSDLLVSLVEPSFADLGVTVEESLEGLLASLDFETELDLLGATVGLSLYPSLIRLDEAGMVLGLGARITVSEPSDCVDWSGGSDTQGSGWPDFDAFAGATSLEPDIGLYVGKDFGDHLLYSLWATGFLCIDAGEFLGGGGFTAGTFHAALGEPFTSIFPEDTPLSLKVVPDLPPTMGFSPDRPPMAVELHQLGLELHGPLDKRTVRILRLDLEGDIGIDVALEEIGEDTGGDTAALPPGPAIVTGIQLDPDDLLYLETHGDLIGRGFADGLSPIVGSLLGSAVPTDGLPSISLPDLFGLELAALIWEPEADGRWHGGYILLDASEVQAIELGGCAVDGLGCGGDSGGIDISLEDAIGCDDTALGCEGTACSQAGATAEPLRLRAWRGRLGLVLSMLALIGLRRRA